jgi:tight adherence protein B
MNYRKYTLTFWEKSKLFVISIAISCGIAYLFFENPWICIIFPLVYLIIRKKTIENRKEKQQKELSIQFLDAMRVVSSSLLAGLSLENAWKEGQREVEFMYGTDAYMSREMKEMNQSVSLNVPLEQQLEEFAYRSGVEDIISFAEVFSFAKRMGGNFVEIIESTIGHMREKQETEQEIEVVIASRKLEQKVMDVIPILILAYLKLTSGDYMEVLYGNAAGVIFMSICLVIYIAALYLANRIMTIKV